MISIACYFLLFSVVFAFDMEIYNGRDYFTRSHLSGPVPSITVNNTYGFEYHLDEMLMMDIILKNQAPNVNAAFYLTHTNSSQTSGNTMKIKNIHCDDGDCLELHYINLKSQYIYISMQLYRGTAECATYIILKGSATLSNTTSEGNLCVDPSNCVLVIDLQNECIEDNTGQVSTSASPSTSTLYRNNVFIYAISSVVVLCGSILVIYLSVKKCRNRSSGPGDASELNTYATRNEVLYADLSFLQGNSQPPRHEEESPYAKIVGVMRPQK